MKILILLIAAIAFADQILHVTSKKCDVQGECQGLANSEETCTDNKCVCVSNFHPTTTGCADTMETPAITGTTTILKDGTLKLICTSGSEFEDMTYTWMRNGDSTAIGKSKELLISGATPTRTDGEYKCTTESTISGVGPKTSSGKQVTVLETPIIHGSTDAIVGAPHSLSCFSKTKGVQYKWTSPSGNTPTKPFYTIPAVKGVDLGSYTCTVTHNRVPATSAVHAVSVFSSIGDMCKPVIKGARSINQGDLLFLVCDWNHDLSVEYVWSLPLSETQLTSKGYIYEVNTATDKDQGAYKCTVKYNGEELESAVFNVAVTSKSPVVVDTVDPSTVKPGTFTSKPEPVAKLNGVTHAAGSVLMMVASLVISNILF